VASLPSVAIFAFLLVVSIVQLGPTIQQHHQHILPEYLKDSQLIMGPTLSKGTLEAAYLTPFYIFFTSLFVLPFIVLMRQMWALILIVSTAMLPSSLRDYTGRFFEAIKRGVLYSC